MNNSINYKSFSLRRIGLWEKEQVKGAFLKVFTSDPWYDDWSDWEQLDMYLTDLMGQNYSLAFGLFEGDELVGASLGYIKHWYTGTEYIIDELFIVKEKQGRGIGTYFLDEISRTIKTMGIKQIFLLTDRDAPAYDFYQKNGFQELPGNVAFWKEI